VTWESEAANWIAWAREPGHDSYWRFHRDEFLPRLPPPGRLTLDIGCGEGRLTRDLAARGHRVVAVDSSATMLAAAREMDPEGEYVEADFAKLPFEDGAADLAVAFMSLMEVEDIGGPAKEIARVLEPGGALAVAVVHPLNSALLPHDEDPESLTIKSYRVPHAYSVSIDSSGLRMTFRSYHYPLEDYWQAIRGAGFVIEELREVYDDTHPRWRKVPLFLHLRALKPA
jgi:SAM-dependent methyltransferase